MLLSPLANGQLMGTFYAVVMKQEIWNEGNYDLADELIDPNFVDHDSATPEEVSGIEGFKEFVAMYRSGFSDTHIVIEDQVAEGDKVVTRWTTTGTHDGGLWDIAPTGTRVEITGLEIARISGGKVPRRGILRSPRRGSAGGIMLRVERDAPTKEAGRKGEDACLRKRIRCWRAAC
jgi:predicted ester cyclase